MESVRNTDQHYSVTSQPISEPRQSIDSSKSGRYEPLDYSEIARGEVKKASMYKIIAYIAMGVGLAIFAGAIALTAIALASNPITATAASIIVFAVGAKLYQSIIKNKVFKYFKDCEAQSLRNAEIAMSTHKVIQKFGKNPRTENWTKRDWETSGKVEFCREKSIQLQKESDALSNKINVLAQNLFDCDKPITPDARNKLSNKIAQIRSQKHVKSEEALLYKVNAAYQHYILINPTEEREISEFCDIRTMSLRDADTHSALNKHRFDIRKPLIPDPSYITLKSNQKIGFTRDQIRSMQITELSHAVFKRQKAA